MPELPEVETIKRSLAPSLVGQYFTSAIIRTTRLRWPVPTNLANLLSDQSILSVWRRAKYLIIELSQGALLIHLGMSGQLRLLPQLSAVGKHDHIDLLMDNGLMIRLTDPRRFGALLWQFGPAHKHPLLSKLGVEPLDPAFNVDYLQKCLTNKKTTIKAALMENTTVVGIGNIYVNEILFRAAILPQRLSNTLKKTELTQLVLAIKTTLTDAIQAGGSTLRDFVDGTGRKGHFQKTYFVYKRYNANCYQCGALIQQQRLKGRSTFFCRNCQH